MKKIMILLASLISVASFANEKIEIGMSNNPAVYKTNVCRVSKVDQSIDALNNVIERVFVGGDLMQKAINSGNMEVLCKVSNKLIEELEEVDYIVYNVQKMLDDPKTFEKYKAKCGMDKQRLSNLKSITITNKELTEGLIQDIKDLSPACR